MPRRRHHDAPDSDAHYLLQRLSEQGDDAPTIEEQLAIVHALRARSPESSDEVDDWLLQELTQLRENLQEAGAHQAHLKGVLDKLSATPWHAAVFLGGVETDRGPSATVSYGGTLRVVGLADGVSMDDLAVGDDVLLGRDLNVIMRRSSGSSHRASEVAAFQRALPDGRLIVKRRDEDVVVRAGGAIATDNLRAGDSVRWDPQLGLALENLGRAEESALFLETMPTETFDSLGGLDQQIARLQRSLRLHLLHPELVQRYRLRRNASVLFVGPPGTGKTMMARALAHWVGVQSASGRSRFMHIKPGALHSVWYSQSEANYREAFRVAREAGAKQPDVPVVMFFDEVDAIGSTRGEGVTRVDDRVLTSFMAELDGLEARGNILVVAATNRRETVDPALLRPGRLGDLVLDIPRPGMAAAASIFDKHLPDDIPYAGDAEARARRQALITTAVSRLYAPNGEGEVASIMFRDGTRRAIHARDLISGANIAKIARVAVERACMREAEVGTAGVEIGDVLDAIVDELDCAVSALTPANCHAHVCGLPQDLAVVRVEPVVRRVRRPHRFVRVA